MAEKLDSRRYVRVHRSHIVRVDQVVSLTRRATGSYSLVLEGGEVIPVGRRYRRGIGALRGDLGAQPEDEGGPRAAQ
jgi:DNA-binding LytR/AlgR family response regulator